MKPIDILKQLAQFDQDAAYSKWKQWADSGTEGPYFAREFLVGAKWQHEQDKKIIDLQNELLEMALEALKAVIAESGTSTLHYKFAKDAEANILARLEAEKEKLKDKEG